MKRPDVGTVVELDVRVRICTRCAHQIDDELCSVECPLDGDSHEGSTLIAVWHRVDTFLRDEKADA